MTLLKIARLGHPVLLAPAAPVEDVHDPEIQRLIDDMIETMHDAGGVGLAAPQVHVSRRIFVYYVPLARREDADDVGEGVQVLVNPELTPVDDEQIMRLEGCLSIPGLKGWVPRHARIRYAGLDRKGRRVEGQAAGFHANVLQHEADHLDGILYPMRMTDLGLMGFEPEVSRFLMMDMNGTKVNGKQEKQ